jgi:hypothetical protein
MDPDNENKPQQLEKTNANIFQGDLNEEEEVNKSTGQSDEAGLNF